MSCTETKMASMMFDGHHPAGEGSTRPMTAPSVGLKADRVAAAVSAGAVLATEEVAAVVAESPPAAAAAAAAGFAVEKFLEAAATDDEAAVGLCCANTMLDPSSLIPLICCTFAKITLAEGFTVRSSIDRGSTATILALAKAAPDPHPAALDPTPVVAHVRRAECELPIAGALATPARVLVIALDDAIFALPRGPKEVRTQ